METIKTKLQNYMLTTLAAFFILLTACVASSFLHDAEMAKLLGELLSTGAIISFGFSLALGLGLMGIIIAELIANSKDDEE